MHKELAQYNLFHKRNKYFQEYFFKKHTTKSEKEHIDLLTEKVLAFYKKVLDEKKDTIDIYCFDSNFCCYGYLEGYGYYTIMYDGRGYYFVEGYHEDIHKAFVDIVNNILQKNSLEYVTKYNLALKADYKKRFNSLKYDQLISRLEYEIGKWYQFYDGQIDEYVISVYQKKLLLINSDDETNFEYNENANIIITNSKTKKLIRKEN